MSLNRAPFPLSGRKALLLVDGELSTFGAKTAVCYLRYRPNDVGAVVAPEQAGAVVQDVLGFGGTIPVVASVDEALALGVEVAIVGNAPRGGQLTASLRSAVLACLQAGLDTASGLHTLIREDGGLVAAAEASGARMWDVRRVSPGYPVGSGAGCTTGARVVLTVGTDGNVGKMTATVEAFQAAQRRGMNAAWAATGQTGILIRERGIAVDRVISDFVGGATEELVNTEGKGRDIVFVEGQGSLLHPGFAGVTLGLLYGAMPDAMVLVHAAARKTIADSAVGQPALEEWIRRYEDAMRPFKPSPVLCVALNTAGLGEREAATYVSRLERDVGRPVSDPVRDRGDGIVDAVEKYLEARLGGSS